MAADESLLVRLGLDAGNYTRGLQAAQSAGSRFVGAMKSQAGLLAGLSVLSGFSLTKQIRTIKDWTHAASIQEAAIIKLDTALHQDQRTREDSIGVLTRQAAALQKTTQFGDEQTISMQAMLASFGLTTDQILKLTPLVQDLTVNLQKAGQEEADMSSISLALGKAISTGSAGALSRYGIAIKVAKGETLDFNTVLRQLENSGVKGMAEAVGQTSDVTLKRLSNAIGDVKEKLGSALAPTLIQIVNAILPMVNRFEEWVSANQSLVLSIVGGGVFGVGVLGAMTAFMTVANIMGAAAGPIGLATLAVAALVGWLVKMRLESLKIPNTIQGIADEIKTTQEQANTLNNQISRLGKYDPGRLVLQKQLDDKLRHLAALQKAQEQATAPKLEPVPFTIPKAGEGGAGAKADKNAEALQRWMDTLTGAQAERAKEALEKLGLAGDQQPIDREGDAMVSLFRERMGIMQDYADTAKETNEKIVESEKDKTARLIAEHDAQVADVARQTLAFQESWSDGFANALLAGESFGKALSKSLLLTIMRVIGAEVKAAIQKILVAKIAELGKAAIMAPLSFGASLAASGPIIAAAAAAIGGLSALQSKLAGNLQGSFATGGTIPRTGAYQMHEGEIVFNPRTSSSSQTMRFLRAVSARAGANKPMMGSGGVNLSANFYGDVRSKADVDLAMKVLHNRYRFALGAQIA